MDSLFFTFRNRRYTQIPTEGKWNYEAIKEFAKEQGKSVKNYYVLKLGNDPYYFATESRIRQAKWCADIVNQMLTDLQIAKSHDRKAFYYALSKNVKRPVSSTSGRIDFFRVFGIEYNSDWQWLQQGIKYARLLGILPMEAIVEKKNPQPSIWAKYYRHSDFSDLVPDINTIIDAIVERTEVTKYFNPLLLQKYHVEIWTEKTTLNDILDALCKKYKVNLQPFSGEATLTRVYELMKRIKQFDKPIRILYISDYDKSGHNMPVATGRKIKWFIDNRYPNVELTLEKILLTKEQIEKYDLPSAPDDPNKVEIDALPIFVKGETEKIVENAISQYIDIKAIQKVEEINSAIVGEVRERLSELEQPITKLASIIKEYFEERELGKIDDTVLPKALVKENSPYLQIYDSARDYLTQVKVFQDYQKKRED